MVLGEVEKREKRSEMGNGAEEEEEGKDVPEVRSGKCCTFLQSYFVNALQINRQA